MLFLSQSDRDIFKNCSVCSIFLIYLLEQIQNLDILNLHLFSPYNCKIFVFTFCLTLKNNRCNLLTAGNDKLVNNVNMLSNNTTDIRYNFIKMYCGGNKFFFFDSMK